MSENALILELKKEGYGRVYTWHEGPLEVDEDHQHEFDTKIVVLKGEITVETNGKKVVAREGDAVYTPRNTVHRATTGEEGCTYVVAEKH